MAERLTLNEEVLNFNPELFERFVEANCSLYQLVDEANFDEPHSQLFPSEEFSSISFRQELIHQVGNILKRLNSLGGKKDFKDLSDCPEWQSIDGLDRDELINLYRGKAEKLTAFLDNDYDPNVKVSWYMGEITKEELFLSSLKHEIFHFGRLTAFSKSAILPNLSEVLKTGEFYQDYLIGSIDAECELLGISLPPEIKHKWGNWKKSI